MQSYKKQPRLQIGVAALVFRGLLGLASPLRTLGAHGRNGFFVPTAQREPPSAQWAGIPSPLPKHVVFLNE